MKTYIFNTNLFENKKISRKIEVAENISLYQLAKAIVKAYDFNFDHCFGFFSKVSPYGYFGSEEQYELFTDLIEEGEEIEPTGAGSVKKTKVNEVWRKLKDRMMFLFDYGDNWRFLVELVDFGKKDAKKKYPRIIKKIGRAPKQYPKCQ